MRKHNLGVIGSALKDIVVPQMDSFFIGVLDEVGLAIKSWIVDKHYTYENQTYNLTDSTGAAIYVDGVLTSFQYFGDQQAVKPRIIRRSGQQIEINGRELLTMALSNGYESYGKYTLLVISAAPYAAWVDAGAGTPRNDGLPKRGTGWWSGSGGLEEYTKKVFDTICHERGLTGQGTIKIDLLNV